MTDIPLTLFCLIDGEATSNAFPVEIIPTKSIGDLKDFIKVKKTNDFSDVDANQLTLWRVSIPVVTANRNKPIILTEIDSITELDPTDDVSDVFADQLPKKTIHIIVQRPPPAFVHLKDDLRVGDSIIMPSMGQSPKDSSPHGQGRKLFVTEQMLKHWEDMRGDKERTYRRVLSGPMGVGKSYLSYFLAARAYAEGWLVLYISGAGLLDRDDEIESALQLVKRFLALNKDILTGAALEVLVNDYDGTYNISFNSLSVIFEPLLKSRERKTLLLVDEHGKLFEKEPYIPDKFRSLVPLSSYHWWGEDAKGSRVIFTGIAHAKYEMTILDDCYRQWYVVFVGPLSRNVFFNLLDTYPRLRAQAIKKEVIEITNCVPRELVYLSANVKDLSPISVDDLQQWTENRTKDFRSTAKTYYSSCSQRGKE
ncbi:hypothetical protein BG003_006199 [Podila horticola]|nr:hypothetical protein BG003_006199 [Podila horticola]